MRQNRKTDPDRRRIRWGHANQPSAGDHGAADYDIHDYQAMYNIVDSLFVCQNQRTGADHDFAGIFGAESADWGSSGDGGWV